MALSFSGTNSLPVRLGKIAGRINSIFNFQGGGSLTAPAKSAGVSYTDLLAQFVSGTAQSDQFDGFVANILAPSRAKSAEVASLKSFAQALFIRTVNDDTVLKAYTLPYAMAEFVRQMAITSSGTYVTGPTVAATTPTAATGNTGTAVCVSSITGPNLPGGVVGVTGAGAMALPYIFPETMRVVCTGDSFSGGATLYSEPFSIIGQPAANTDPLTWNFTSVYGATAINGSGVTVSTNVCDAARYAGSGAGGNLLQNGDFLNFSPANTPSNWTLVTGSAGTGFLDGGAGSGIIGGSSHSIQLVCDATPTLLAMKQQTNNSGGTTSALLPNTVYAVGYWVKGTTSNVGNLNIALVDGSSSLGAVVNDNNGTANTGAVDVSTLTGSYVFKSFFFRTPNVLPSTGVFLRVSLSGALVNAKTINISNLAMRAVSPLYAGGPYLALFSGLTGAVAGDQYNAAFTNDYGNLSLKHGMLWAFNQLFDARSSGLAQLPITGSTLINDSLVS